MTDIIAKAGAGVSRGVRARLARTKTCSACNARLGSDVPSKRRALCDGCFARAVRIVLRPCRN